MSIERATHTRYSLRTWASLTTNTCTSCAISSSSNQCSIAAAVSIRHNGRLPRSARAKTQHQKLAETRDDPVAITRHLCEPNSLLEDRVAWPLIICLGDDISTSTHIFVVLADRLHLCKPHANNPPCVARSGACWSSNRSCLAVKLVQLLHQSDRLLPLRASK